MIHDILATQYKTYKTQGNYNNEIGLPQALFLHMPDETEKLVLKWGQDHLGDIHLLSEIAKPSLSVITPFGEAHLEFFGSREEIAKENYRLRMEWNQVVNSLIPADPIADKLGRAMWISFVLVKGASNKFG